MRSLRARLFVGLSAIVVATNIGIGVLAYRRAVEEATELQDAVLRQVGRFAVRAGVPTDEASSEDEPEFRIVVEELERLPAGPLSAHVPPAAPDGFATIDRGGRAWRLLVLARPDGGRLAVGQSMASRDARARDALLQTLGPVLLLVPCLLALVGLLIQGSFRSLSALAGRLDERTTDDLRTLPTDGLPDELTPFVQAINRLLARVGQLFEQRRRFVADAAHELRTPITALTVQAENLSRHAPSAEGRARLHALQGGIRRVGHLLEQLLSLARYDVGPALAASPASLDNAARDVVADLMPAAADRSMDLGFGRIEATWVDADPTGLRVLVRNLLDNALRHSMDGARIDVEVYRDGDEGTVRIADTGPGIPDEELGRIFDPFVRGGRVDAEGTGLGLSIVRSIVEAQGGSVHLANRTSGEGGLVATVRLPMARQAGRTKAGIGA